MRCCLKILIFIIARYIAVFKQKNGLLHELIIFFIFIDALLIFLKSCGIEKVEELPNLEEIRIKDEQLVVSDFNEE